MRIISSACLAGKNDSDIDCQSLGLAVHREVVAPFLALRERAMSAGFDLALASGFRSFDRQCTIWNAKARGERPLLNSDGQPIDSRQLGRWELVQAILRWSALPGASRHHWGTDLDVFDRAAVPDDYHLQLISDEVADDGPFGPFHCWLDEQIKNGDAEGFFRPYEQDRGGIAPERWHISYAPLAADYQRQVTVEVLLKMLEHEDVVHKSVIEEHMADIFQRFVNVPAESYPVEFRDDLSKYI